MNITTLPKNRAIVVVTDNNPVDAQRPTDGRYVNSIRCEITHGCLKQEAFLPIDFMLSTEIIKSDGSRVIFNSEEQALQELKGVKLRYHIGRSARGNFYRMFVLMA